MKYNFVGCFLLLTIILSSCTPNTSANNPQSPQLDSLPTMKEYAWTYQSTTITVKYPESWIAEEKFGNQLSIYQPNRIVVVSIWAVKNGRTPEQEILFQFSGHKNPTEMITKPTNSIISGITTCNMDWRYTTDGVYSRLLGFNKGQYTYLMSGMLHQDVYRAELDAIYSSLKIS